MGKWRGVDRRTPSSIPICTHRLEKNARVGVHAPYVSLLRVVRCKHLAGASTSDARDGLRKTRIKAIFHARCRCSSRCMRRRQMFALVRSARDKIEMFTREFVS